MMRAAVLEGENQPVTLAGKPEPEPGTNEVLIRMHYGALNHRDLWMQKGMYPGDPAGITLGSDGCGIVEQTGESVDPNWKGWTVVVNPGHEWGDDPAAQSKNFKILGKPDDGTLAEYLLVPVDYVHAKPEHLSDREAAGLPLAGLTAYRALFSRAGLRKGEHVLITGIGGGVALTAMQLAMAAGARVWVTSGSDDKIKKACDLGAEDGFRYDDEEWHKQAQEGSGGFHVIIDSAAGPGFPKLVDAARPGGRIAIYGRTAGQIDGLEPARVFWRQISILGSTMGNEQEFADMLDFCARKQVHPVLDREFSLDETEQAFRHLDRSEQFGKVLVRIQE